MKMSSRCLTLTLFLILFMGAATCSAQTQTQDPYAAAQSALVRVHEKTTKLSMKGPFLVWDAHKGGNGFIVSESRDIVVTTYHKVACIPRNKLRVEGIEVANVIPLTGPNDPEARFHYSKICGIVKLALKNDLALLVLKKPLPPQFQVMPIALAPPRVG